MQQNDGHPSEMARRKGEEILKGHQEDRQRALAEAEAAFKEAERLGYDAWMELWAIDYERCDDVAARAYRLRGEALAEKNEASANFNLYLIHNQLQGDGADDVQEEKVRQYLRRAAALGDTVAQTCLAQCLLWGLNNFETDEHEYEVWIWRAIDQGYDPAVLTYAETALKLKRVKDARILDRLAQLSKDSPQDKRAARLHGRLKRLVAATPTKEVP